MTYTHTHTHTLTDKNQHLKECTCAAAATVSLPPPGGCVGKALSYINKQFFSDANGNRGGAPNVAVVLVDGWPTDKVEEASRLARESGINIFFVTIEGPDDNEKHNLVEVNFVDKVGDGTTRRRHFQAGDVTVSTLLHHSDSHVTAQTKLHRRVRSMTFDPS